MAGTYEIDLYPSDDEGELWWGAEGGIEGSSQGTDFTSTPDLAELVREVEGEVRRLQGGTEPLSIRWRLAQGSEEEFAPALRAAGITLG